MFSIPLIILLFIGEWALWTTRESWPVTKVAGLQHDSAYEVLYSRSLMSQQFGIYKLAGIRKNEPEIVIVGSSRVMQFRDFMFAPLDRSFYNAGGMVESVDDLSDYADLVVAGDVPKPKVVLIGIDVWWFTERPDQKRVARLVEWDDAYRFAAHTDALKAIVSGKRFGDVCTAIRERRYSTLGRNFVGVAPAVNGSGFRNDGSWRCPQQMFDEFVRDPRYADRERPPVIERIRTKSAQFAPPTNFSDRHAASFVAATERLLRSNIEVIAFFPPFSSECQHAISQYAELQTLVNGCHDQLATMLEMVGVSVVRLDSLKLPDEYMIDGFHLGEVYAAHVVRKICEDVSQGSRLLQIDRTELEGRIESAEIPLAFAVDAVFQP